MDGVIVSTSSPLQRLAAYLKTALPAAGYTYEEGRRTGDLARLADNTQKAAERLGGNFTALDTGALGRLIRAERMPRATALAPLADALDIDYRELMVEAGIIPDTNLPESATPQVRSRPTPEQVAAAWGIDDDAGRAVVRAMYERLAIKPSDPGAEDEPGGTQAQG